MNDASSRRPAFWVRVINNAVGAYFKIEQKARRFWWNQQPGIHVASTSVISRSAKLDLRPLGYWEGGSITIHSGVHIAESALLIPYGGEIVIGENVFIGPYTVIYGNGNVTINADSLIAGHVFIVANNHSAEDIHASIRSQPFKKQGIVIKEDVWIGSGVQVLDGVTIGKGCVVGAGAVVNKSLPDYSVAVGVPVKVIKSRNDSTVMPRLS